MILMRFVPQRILYIKLIGGKVSDTDSGAKAKPRHYMPCVIEKLLVHHNSKYFGLILCAPIFGKIHSDYIAFL